MVNPLLSPDGAGKSCAGRIMFLPDLSRVTVRNRNFVRPQELEDGAFGHPVVLLGEGPNVGCVLCVVVTSLGGCSVEDRRFTATKRELYIPIHPAENKFTLHVLYLEVDRRLPKKSYARIDRAYELPFRLLEPYHEASGGRYLKRSSHDVLLRLVHEHTGDYRVKTLREHLSSQEKERKAELRRIERELSIVKREKAKARAKVVATTTLIGPRPVQLGLSSTQPKQQRDARDGSVAINISGPWTVRGTAGYGTCPYERVNRPILPVSRPDASILPITTHGLGHPSSRGRYAAWSKAVGFWSGCWTTVSGCVPSSSRVFKILPGFVVLAIAFGGIYYGVLWLSVQIGLLVEAGWEALKRFASSLGGWCWTS